MRCSNRSKRTPKVSMFPLSQKATVMPNPSIMVAFLVNAQTIQFWDSSPAFNYGFKAYLFDIAVNKNQPSLVIPRETPFVAAILIVVRVGWRQLRTENHARDDP